MSGPPRPVRNAREWAARAGILPWYAGGRAFSPLDLPGLRLWLDAADLSTITESSGAISQWDDKSSQGSAATQGNATVQPALVTNALNSLPVVRFTDDSMRVNDPALFRDAAVGTVFAVVKAAVGTGTRRYVLGVSGPDGEATRFGAMSREQSADRMSVTGRRLDDDSLQLVVPGSTSHNGEWHVVCWEISWIDAFARVRQDGADIATSDSFQTPGRTSDTNSQNVILSGLSGSVRNTMDLAELLVFRTETRLTAGEVAQVERYLVKKWGLPLS